MSDSRSDAQNMGQMPEEIECYIHIPFCVRKCLYCDFLSFPAGRDTEKRYTDALKREIRSFFREPFWENRRCRLRSVFIGGGTPSVLPAEWIEEILGELMENLPQSFSVEMPCEITMEANPGTLDLTKLSRYRAAGINRLSLGCQSASDRELRELGRIHSFGDFQESFRFARAAGFANISVDLMSGLPGQTMESWENSLRAVAELGPEHISSYSLILEEGTPLFARYRYNNIEEGPAAPVPPLPDEDTERDMYHRTAEILGVYGFRRYEISNYARPGYESRHNTGYWDGTWYKGFGLGAASYLPAAAVTEKSGDADTGTEPWGWRARLRNTDSLDAYLEHPAQSWHIEEKLSVKDQMAEFMILGLRMLRGVSEDAFAERFGISVEEKYGEVLAKQTAEGLLLHSDGRYFLSERGLDLANQVMVEFI